jgi:hypothetical protein
MIPFLNWFRRGSLERGLDRELQCHSDRRVAVELGLAQLREEVRDIWLTRWFRDFPYDLSFSAWSFLRRPGFTAATLLSLALGIAANETFGMQCVGSYIEILVREMDSDHFSVLPFDIQQATIEREQRDDLNYSIFLAGPILRTGARHNAYGVHFVMKETRTRQELVISLVVDLLEEKIGKLPFSIKDGRITQLVPLIGEQDTAGSQD